MRLASLVNQYVSEQAPWATSRTTATARGPSSTSPFAAVDSLKTLFTPFLPFTSQTLHELLGYEDVIAGPLEFQRGQRGDGPVHGAHGRLRELGRRVGAERRSRRGQALREPRPLFRKLDPIRSSPTSWRGWRAPRSVIDTHAHLERSRTPAPRSSGRARPASTRVISRHRDRLAAAPRSRSPAANDGVYAALGIHPHQAGSEEADRVARAARAARQPHGGRGRRDRARLPLRRRDDASSAVSSTRSSSSRASSSSRS